MPELNDVIGNPNDIYIIASYMAGAVVLVGLALITWRDKRNDENDLRKLEDQIQKLSEEQSKNNG